MIVSCVMEKDDWLSEALIQELVQSPLGHALYDVMREKSLTTDFQPIVDVKKQTVYAYEALTRGPESTAFYHPLNLFHAAIDHNCLLELDLLARQVAIKNYKKYETKHNQNVFLFLNVSVQTFLHFEEINAGVTIDCLHKLGISPERVVIEITELQPVEDYELFVKSVMHYREMGFKVAIDDLGGGYNGLRLWSEVCPDFVKIDKHFVTDVHNQKRKQRFIETIVTLAKGMGTKIVAEGVEVKEELFFLREAGVDLVQGYLFKKPKPIPSVDLDFDWLPSQQYKKQVFNSVETVEMLSQPHPFVEFDLPVSKCSKMMLEDPNLEFLPVVKNGSKVKGVVWRKDLMELLARPYGQSLLHRKEVKKIMDHLPIVVDYKMPLVDLSRMLTDTEMEQANGAFVITKDGHYHGMGTLNQLLTVMTDLRVQSAQFANPLSGLPGNTAIQKILQQNIENKQAFIVCYVDVDHFKPYNDHYSFEEGDQVIKLIAELLSELSQGDDFVGHVGGDDFMVVTKDKNRAMDMVNSLLKKFSISIAQFYEKSDREQGGIYAKNRDGKETFYEMMTLSIGVLIVETGAFSHTQELASYATQAKKGAKNKGGNTFFVVETDALK